MEKSYKELIANAEKEFSDEDTFIVNYYDDEGKDYDEEYNTFTEAVEGLQEQEANYETFNGGSINSLMAKPSLSHPSGSGLEWDFDSAKWM